MSEGFTSANDPEALVAEYVRERRPDLKDVIIVQYSGTVERIARRFAGVEPVDDLVQVGYIGLLNALSKFDPSAGVRFSTYATHLVAGEIKHYLRDRAQTIRHPAWLQELRHKVQRVSSQLQASLGRVPSNREIADACGVSEDAVADVFTTQEMIRVASLDAPGPDGEDTEVERLDSAESETAQISVEDRVVLFEAMTQLRELERNVVVLFHFESLSQAEIANRLSISCNYVSHILRQSHGKLRTLLGPQHSEKFAPAWSTGDGGETVDPLTGCYTEAYLHGRLTEELHRLSSRGGTLSLVTVEFEGFESYGQFYGEDSVRQALADAADHIRAASRSLDIVCRLGETGFAVILPGTGSASGIVRDRIAGKFSAWTGAGQGRVTARIGVAVGSRALGGAAAFVDAARESAIRSQDAA